MLETNATRLTCPSHYIVAVESAPVLVSKFLSIKIWLSKFVNRAARRTDIWSSLGAMRTRESQEVPSEGEILSPVLSCIGDCVFKCRLLKNSSE
jgi:hypothetical protein